MVPPYCPGVSLKKVGVVIPYCPGEGVWHGFAANVPIHHYFLNQTRNPRTLNGRPWAARAAVQPVHSHEAGIWIYRAGARLAQQTYGNTGRANGQRNPVSDAR